jgi:hypothetical protein
MSFSNTLQNKAIKVVTDNDLARLNQSTHVLLYYAQDCFISQEVFHQYEKLVTNWTEEYPHDLTTFAITDVTQNTQLGALVRLRSFPLLVV